MAISSSGSRTPAASRVEGGIALVAIGGALLLVSLFLNWYQPGSTAWAVFEVWDLVLALLALTALVAVAGRLGLARSRPDSWLVVPSVAAFVIVVASLLNHPPAAIGEDPMVGIWLALTAAGLMLVGVALSVARVSVAIKIHDRAGDAARPAPPGPAVPSPTAGVRGGRFRSPASAGMSPVDEAAAVSGGRPKASFDPDEEATRVLENDPSEQPGARDSPR